MSIRYCSHIQDIGWQNYVSEGEVSGTIGLSKRMVAIKIDFYHPHVLGTIQYSVHVQNIGWMEFVGDNEVAGTTGQSLRIEAIKIRLTGDSADMYDIYYQCHVQNVGWMGWAKNGEEAGTTGYAYRCEAIRISLVFKNDPAPGSTADCFRVNPNPLYPVLRFPVNYVDVTGPFTGPLPNQHRGVDLGWISGSYPFDPIIAPCDMNITDSGWNSVVGNYIFARVSNYSEGRDLMMRFIHMSSLSIPNQYTGNISEEVEIGRMGNTGTSANGELHLHCDCCNIPSSYGTFSFTDSQRSDYSIDPLTVFHLKSGQSVHPTTDQQYTILRG